MVFTPPHTFDDMMEEFDEFDEESEYEPSWPEFIKKNLSEMEPTPFRRSGYPKYDTGPFTLREFARPITPVDWQYPPDPEMVGINDTIQGECPAQVYQRLIASNGAKSSAEGFNSSQLQLRIEQVRQEETLEAVSPQLEHLEDSRHEEIVDLPARKNARPVKPAVSLSQSVPAAASVREQQPGQEIARFSSGSSMSGKAFSVDDLTGLYKANALNLRSSDNGYQKSNAQSHSKEYEGNWPPFSRYVIFYTSSLSTIKRARYAKVEEVLIGDAMVIDTDQDRPTVTLEDLDLEVCGLTNGLAPDVVRQTGNVADHSAQRIRNKAADMAGLLELLRDSNAGRKPPRASPDFEPLTGDKF